jgi:hypothetical protein
MRTGFSILLICWAGISLAQHNLVPNPSFEENTGCPGSPSHIWLAPLWERVGGNGAISYYHECGQPCCGVPFNRGGWQNAHHGQAYSDLSLLHNNHIHSLELESNFLGSELVTALESGKKYNVEFHLSLYDSVRFACRNVGVHFSSGRPVDVSWPASVKTAHLLSLTPQVRYEGDFLSDKDRWMRIAGSFIAEGGENYISIGNFDGYANSDTLNLHEGGVLDASGAYNIGYWEVANYFIDDVSVVEDTSFHVGIENHLSIANGQWAIHPNPAAEAIIIETEDGGHLALGLYDMAGREVLSMSLQSSKQTIGIGHLPAGVYVAVLREKGVEVARRKLVKQ